VRGDGTDEYTTGFSRRDEDDDEDPLLTVCVKSRGHRRVQSHER
jgi:hypothetical protein